MQSLPHLVGQAGWLFFRQLALGADLKGDAVRSHLEKCLKTSLNNNVAQIRVCKPVIHIIYKRKNKLEVSSTCTMTYVYDEESFC